MTGPLIDATTITLYYVGTTAEQAIGRDPFGHVEEARTYAEEGELNESIWSVTAYVDFATVALCRPGRG